MLTQANEAKAKTEIATEDEQRKIAMLEAKTNIENTEFQGITIPAGFAPTRIAGESTVDEGLVIIDSEGNEFVWIPVESADAYKTNTSYEKTEASTNTKNDTGYLPDDIDIGEPTEENTIEELTFEKEKELVTSKGGFYISRYEAGDSSAEANRTSASDGTLVSKKDAYVYNWIKQTDAKEKAKTFINNEYVKSALASGIQWDMVMNFITKEPPRKDGNGKNDYIVTTANSNRHHSSGVEQCGQNETDEVCNIYDLEGNCWEYVAEKYTYGIDYPYIARGGSCSYSDSASHRDFYDGNDYYIGSFRFVLYIM